MVFGMTIKAAAKILHSGSAWPLNQSRFYLVNKDLCPRSVPEKKRIRIWRDTKVSRVQFVASCTVHMKMIKVRASCPAVAILCVPVSTVHLVPR